MRASSSGKLGKIATDRSGVGGACSIIGFGGGPRFNDVNPKVPGFDPNLWAPNPGEGGGFEKGSDGAKPGDIGGRDNSSGASPVGGGGGLDVGGGASFGDGGGFANVNLPNLGDGGGFDSANVPKPGDGGGFDWLMDWLIDWLIDWPNVPNPGDGGGLDSVKLPKPGEGGGFDWLIDWLKLEKPGEGGGFESVNEPNPGDGGGLETKKDGGGNSESDGWGASIESMLNRPNFPGSASSSFSDHEKLDGADEGPGEIGSPRLGLALPRVRLWFISELACFDAGSSAGKGAVRGSFAAASMLSTDMVALCVGLLPGRGFKPVLGESLRLAICFWKSCRQYISLIFGLIHRLFPWAA
jgi:hypothetical protein